MRNQIATAIVIGLLSASAAASGQPAPQAQGQQAAQKEGQAAPQQQGQALPQQQGQADALPRGGNVPLRVQIVISRYQGEKRTSSMPYELSLRSGAGEASLRLGARIPVPTAAFAPVKEGDGAVALQSYNYENVGINIECSATALENGGFDLWIMVNESSAVTDVDELKTITGGNRPVFRSYQSENRLFMRNGETSQFTAATDRVTGEVVRVEVRLTVLK